MSNTPNISISKKRLMVLFVFIGILVFIGSICSICSISRAQTMSNSDYIIKMGNLNSGSGVFEGSGQKVTFTTGQTGANLFSGPNFTVRAGFQYIYTISPFRFSISNTIIDFGTVSPTVAVLRTNNLKVSNGSSRGYQVTVSQNHNLRSDSSGAQIPKTACDSGHTCSSTAANLWVNSLSYGFGYRCDNVSGNDCDYQFSQEDYFKSFEDSPSSQIVMNAIGRAKNREATITYKLNVSGTQQAGVYQNTIKYIAIPSF